MVLDTRTGQFANAGRFQTNTYSVTNATATLTIPANAYAKTYKTDATLSLNTGP